jgi:membrane protease subunit HflC
MKERGILRFLLLTFLALVVLVLGKMILFVVDETEYVVITRFGEPVRAYVNPGLKIKWPEPIETIHRYDNRLLIYETGEMEFLPEDKKNIILDAFTVWRVDDPVLFLKAVKDEIGAEDKLRDIVSSELGVAVGKYPLDSLVSTDPERIKLDEMMERVIARVDSAVRRYGMRIEDIRIKNLNFPQENRDEVFRRMRAERERIARKYRSEGSGQAERIRAEADKEKERIIAEAYKKAQEIKGQADAEAIRIYAEAYEKDIGFYRLIRTLEAYEKLIDKQTTIILPADSELLRFLNSSKPELLPEKGLVKAKEMRDEIP